MKFQCIRACVDSAQCFSYRLGAFHDFKPIEVNRLKAIDQLKRFVPADPEAKAYIEKMPGGIRTTEALEKEARNNSRPGPDLNAMSPDEIIDYAQHLKETRGFPPCEEKGKDPELEDMTKPQLIAFAKDNGLDIDINMNRAKNSDIINAIEAALTNPENTKPEE